MYCSCACEGTRRGVRSATACAPNLTLIVISVSVFCCPPLEPPEHTCRHPSLAQSQARYYVFFPSQSISLPAPPRPLPSPSLALQSSGTTKQKLQSCPSVYACITQSNKRQTLPVLQCPGTGHREGSGHRRSLGHQGTGGLHRVFGISEGSERGGGPSTRGPWAVWCRTLPCPGSPCARGGSLS